MKLSLVLRCLFSFLLLILISASASASSRDSIPVKALPDTFRIKYFTGSFFREANRKDPYVLDDFQKYASRTYLGNIGQATSDIYVSQKSAHIGFGYFKNDLAANLFTRDSIRYYDAHRPYTKIFFLAGQAKEALFGFTHSQNVNKNLNLAASFNRVRSDGTYLRQSTNLTNISLSSNYKTSDKHYYLLGNIIYNVDKPLVNGGIKTDTSLENSDRPTDKKLLPVNLMTAQRRYMNRSINLHQFFNLGRSHTNDDSSEINVFIPASAISLSTTIGEESNVFYDTRADSLFFQHTYHNHLLTYDSVDIIRVHNALGWNTWKQKRSGAQRRLGAYLNLGNEWIRLRQMNRDSSFSNWMASGGLFNYTDSSSLFRMNLQTEYCLAGYNKGDYKTDLNLHTSLFSQALNVGANAFLSSRTTDFMNLYYNSNNFIWNNKFDKEQVASITTYIRSKKYSFEAGFFDKHLQNTVYYDVYAQPQQYQPGIYILGGYLYKALHLANWTFANRVTYQYSTNDLVIQFPEWITEHSLYYQHGFKNKLIYQFGIDAFYFSSYYGKAYMPSNGQFYNQFARKIGNYPFVDLYFSMQIKTVRLFVKYEHVNSGIPSYSFYMAPGYPAPDRALKLGLTWLFNN